MDEQHPVDPRAAGHQTGSTSILRPHALRQNPAVLRRHAGVSTQKLDGLRFGLSGRSLAVVVALKLDNMEIKVY